MPTLLAHLASRCFTLGPISMKGSRAASKISALNAHNSALSMGQPDTSGGKKINFGIAFAVIGSERAAL